MIDVAAISGTERQILLERERCAKLVPMSWCHPLVTRIGVPASREPPMRQMEECEDIAAAIRKSVRPEP